MTTRIPNLVDETLSDKIAERVRRSHADAIRATSRAIDDLYRLIAAIPVEWAVITASADQATIDESGPDLVTAFDTISFGSANHGIKVTGGIMDFPAGAWVVLAVLVLTHTAAGTAQFQFYEAPSGGNTAIGMASFHLSSTYATSQSGDVPAFAYVEGGTLALRCISTTSTNTVTVEGGTDYSRIYCFRVKAA